VVLKVCPICNTKFVINPLYKDDNIHSCDSANDTLKNIDLVRLGPYTDDDGVSRQVNNSFKLGMANKLWGSRAWIESNNLDDLTSRGNTAATHRTFKREPYAEFEGTLFKKVKL